MRTVIIIGIGIMLALLWLWLARRLKLTKPLALVIFAVSWLGFCGWNMAVGMSHGYGMLEELPFLLANFVVPVVIGFIVSKKVYR